MSETVGNPLVALATPGGEVSAELMGTVLARIARWAPKEVSRAQLAAGWPSAPRLIDRRDLPQASISKAVKGLLESGLVAEGERRRAGKRHYVRLLRIGDGYVTAAAHVAMVKGLPVAVTTVLCDPAGGRVLDTQSEEVGALSTDVWEELAATIHRHTCQMHDGLAGARITLRPKLFGLGVEVPAPVFNGKVTSVAGDTNVELPTIDLGSHLRRAFELGGRFPDIPIVVENDAAALAALAIRDLRYEYSDIAVAAVFHSGVGGGLVMDGRVRRGRSGRAMEIGHLVVDCPPGWPVWGRLARGMPDSAKWISRDEDSQPSACPCGGIGHVDGIATPLSILAALGVRDGRPRLDRAVEGVVPSNLSDRQARLVFARAGSGLGRALSHVFNVVAPSMLIVYVPEELADPPGGNPVAEYMKSCRDEIDSAFAVDSPESARIKLRALPHEPCELECLGARAAAVCALDSVIEQALEYDYPVGL